MNNVHITEETAMLKTLTLIFRGTTARAAEDLADRNALLILDTHVRDSAAGLERARRALAIAIAQGGSELKRLEGVRSRILDLEARARAAFAAGRDDLALEAAEALAGLEFDRLSAEAAHTSFLRETHKLRGMVANAERRVADLERGRRAARASEAVRRLRTNGAASVGGESGSLRDAETVLKRLRDRQLEDEAADRALDELDGGFGPELVAGKLEEAGFGPQTRPTAASILDRLKRAAAREPPSAANP
jgi:phage shock protein A